MTDAHAASSTQPDTRAVRLLEEGALSYLDAATAIAEYRREVRQCCERLWVGKMAEFADALVIELIGDDPKPWASPEIDDIDGSWASIGIKHAFRSPSHGIYGESFFRLLWDRDSNDAAQCFADLSLWLNRKRDCQDIVTALSRLLRREDPFKLCLWDDVNGGSVCFRRELSSADMASFDERMTSVLAAWIDLWRRAGGFKGLFAGASTQSEVTD